MKFHRYVLVILIILITIYANGELDLTTKEKDFLRHHPVINIASLNDMPPVSYKVADQAIGYSKEYMKLIGDFAGFKINYLPTNNRHEAWKLFMEKKAHIFEPTLLDQKKLEFGLQSEVIVQNNIVFISRKNDPINSIDKLKNRTLVLPEGWAVKSFIQKNYPGIKIKSSDSFSRALEMVSSKEADATIRIDKIANHFLQIGHKDDLFISGRFTQFEKTKNHDLYLLIQKELPELYSIILKAQHTIEKQKVKELKEKWFGKNEQKNKEPWIEQNNRYLIIFTLMLAMLIYLSKKLYESNQKIKTNNEDILSSLTNNKSLFFSKHTFALILNIFLLLVILMMVSTILETKKESGYIINLSGKQRMLSQRIMLYAQQYQNQTLTDHSVKEIYKEHIRLMGKENNMLLEKLKNTYAHRFYTKEPNINELVNKYLELHTLFLQTKDKKLLQELFAFQEKLLPLLNKAVSLHEVYLESQINQLMKSLWILFFIFGLAIFLEAGFLFYPTLQKLALLATRLKKEKTSAQNIAKEQKGLLSLFDRSDAVLFRWKNDENWSIEYVSKNVQNLLGYTKDEFLNSRVLYASCINKEDIGRVFEEVKKAKEKNLEFFKHEPYRIITKNGDEKWILDHTVTQKDDNGDISHFIGYLSDISPQINVQKELLKAKVAADHANAAKSSFLANMSHEIRTPLNGIIGLTDLTLETSLDRTQTEYLQKLKQSSHSLLHIINDILDYSKIEAGKLDINISPFYLNEMLQNISNLFSFKIYEKELEFNFTVDHDIPNSLAGDSLRITQILNNFVGNAIKFTHKGYIHIDVQSIKKDEKNITLNFSVKDSGIGISKENQDKLFKSFSQEDSSTTKKYGGTGLGLAISKQLIELMGGEIVFESHKGFGSIFGFTITLGLNSEDEPYTNTDHYYSDKSFLIIDDNEIDRDYLKQILKAWNIASKEAKDGEEAYELILKERFDYLLVDWKMPNLDGLSLLKKLQNKNINLPNILMITAHTKNKLVNEAKNKNITIGKVLEKPYTPSSLYNVLFDKKIQEKFLDTNNSIKLKSLKTALLVEDNETNQLVASKMLENIGFQVEIANDGLEAVEKTKNKNFDIIFMDLQMPNMDGFEASRKIREFEANTPIIALSAAVMDKDKELTAKAGMNDHIAKPINKIELFNIIKKYFQTIKEKKTTENPLLPNMETIDIKRVQKDLNIDEQQLFLMYEKFRKDYGDTGYLKRLDTGSKEYDQYLHKLKGISGNLRINKVYELSKDIYSQGETKKNGQLIEEINKASNDIKQYITPKIETNQTKYDNNEIKQILNSIIDDVENFEYIQRSRINELLLILKGIISKEKLEKLKKGFDQMDHGELLLELKMIKGDIYGK